MQTGLDVVAFGPPHWNSLGLQFNWRGSNSLRIFQSNLRISMKYLPQYACDSSLPSSQSLRRRNNCIEFCFSFFLSFFLSYRSPSHIQNFWTHFRPRSGLEQRISFGWQLSAKFNRKYSKLWLHNPICFTSNTVCYSQKKKKKQQWLDNYLVDS